jgi:hypothetical protein
VIPTRRPFRGRIGSLATRKLDSGITADGGGGMTQLHNTPNVGITNGQTTVTGLHNKPQQ